MRGTVRTRLFAHVETWRLYVSCYVGLVGLAGAALSNVPASPLRYLAAWAVPTLAWLGGLYGGDFFDRELDAEAKPRRPIPSGRLPARVALGCFIGCSVVGGVASLVVNWRTLLLVGMALVAGVSYSTVFKGRGLSGNLVRGVMTSLAFLYGAMMVTDLPAWQLLPVSLVFWAHDAGSNLIGAVRDIDGDRQGGYETFAVRRGATTATTVAAILLAVAYALALAAPTLLNQPWRAGLAIGLLPACALAAAGVVPLFGITGPIRQPAYRAHELLALARVLLAGALLIWAFGWPGLGIAVAALVVTWASQRLLRRRHEFGPASPGDPDPAPPTAAEVLAFVTRQLDLLGRDESLLHGLARWPRVVDIALIDPDLNIRLVVGADGLRLAKDGEPVPDVPVLSIHTTGAVFRDIFLLGRGNPRRAYLSRQLSMNASAGDMIRLNQLFNRFRTMAGQPAEPARVTSREEATRPEPTRLTGTVVVSDTTLRDGEQMPGVVFAPARKRRIAGLLAEVGIPLIEAGFPAVSDEELTTIKSIVDDEPDSIVQVIARPLDRDVDAAVRTGAQSIAVFIGTSESHRVRKLRMSVEEIVAAVDGAVRRAKKAGRQVVFAAEDATRTELDVLLRVCMAAADAGADTLGLADTVGVANPASMAALVREVAGHCPLPIAVHCHNDLGLATANSLAGLLAGASGVQCSVLGIGERAGNAPLEQVVLALHASLDHDTGLDLRRIQLLADEVADAVGIPIPPYQPVVGGHAFTHESGLHVDGLRADPSTYEPYPPDLLGRTRHIVLGKHSGVSAVLAVAKDAGVDLTTEQARAVLTEVKKTARNGGFASPEDAITVVSEFAAEPSEHTANTVAAMTRSSSRR